MTYYKKWNYIFAIITVIFIVIGFIAPEYRLELLATAILYGLFAASVDFSYGYAGILNLGSAIYFGLGAYVMAFGLKAGTGPMIVLIIAVLFSLITAWIIGYVGFRVKASQIHFGLIGLAITLGFQQLAVTLYDLTGGSNGITGVKRPYFLASATHYYFIVIIISMFLLFLLWRLVNSNFGKAMKAMKHDETKLETMGYNPMKVKMAVTGITATISTIAGSLFIGISGIAHPNVFGVVLSMSVLIWVALGGTGSLIGPFFIAMAIKLSETSLSSSFQDTYLLMIGLVFVVMVVVAPDGLFGLGKRLFRLIKKKKSFVKGRGVDIHG